MSTQRQEFAKQLSLAAQKIADMTREVDTTIMIKNSEWTVADTLAHVVVTQKILTSLVSGKKSPYIENTDNFIEEVSQKISRDFIAQLNKKFLSKISQRNGTILARTLIDEAYFFTKESEKHSENKIFRTHYGKMNLSELYSYCLMHMIIHGCAIAKTLNRQLPVTKKAAALTLPFTKIVMLKLFDKKAAKNFTATIVMSIRGVERFAITCDKGKITIKNAIPKNVDCFISADPLEFFLVSIGVISKWMPLLKGKLSVYGKKPWLAFRLQTLFQSL